MRTPLLWMLPESWDSRSMVTTPSLPRPTLAVIRDGPPEGVIPQGIDRQAVHLAHHLACGLDEEHDLRR